MKVNVARKLVEAAVRPMRGVSLAAALMLVGLAVACGGGDGATGDTAGTTPVVPADAGSAMEVAAVVPRASAGCAEAVPPAGTSEQALTVGDEAGTYRQMVPTAAAERKPLPVIIDLHGLGGTVERAALAHGFETLAEQEGAFVLTPNGLGPASASGNNSPEFLEELLDANEQRLCIDVARVFMVGLSWGGRIASTAGCQFADRVAAIGAVSGSFFDAECRLVRPLPIMIFHGTLDTWVQYYGGLGYNFTHPGQRAPAPPTSSPADTQGFPPVESVVAQWAAANGCSAEPETTDVSANIELRMFLGCAEGAAVEFYVISDGQHAWPGADLETFNALCPDCLALGVQPTQEIDATKLLWDFWMRHPLAVGPED